MKTAYFDVKFGAAGDMLVASLLSAGLDEDKWRNELSKIALPPDAYRIKVSQVVRCSIVCKKVDVTDLTGQSLDPLYDTASDEHVHAHPHEHHDHDHVHSHDHVHGHDNSHDHSHTHEHDHSHSYAHAHAHNHSHSHTHPHPHPQTHVHVQHDHEYGHSRDLKAILELIESSTISARAKTLASAIFRRLAGAEARVHGMPADEVHFHEVGAVDAIVDIVGFAIAYDLMKIERAHVSAVSLGQGLVKTEHGLFSVPGPATINLLTEVGAPTVDTAINFECLTPTGAAILCEIADQWQVQPRFTKLLCSGYGAGSKDMKGWPNAVRVVIGETEETALGETDSVCVVEANIDDFSPQNLAYAVDRLFDVGAIDVTVVPALMKKGRSGHLLTVLCHFDLLPAVQKLIFEETSSIGSRWYLAQRQTARREWQSVELPQGSVRIKIARDCDGKIINAQPEYEDCANYARQHGLPLKEVLRQVMANFPAGGM